MAHLKIDGLRGILFPDPVPTEAETLLAMMDEAAAYASAGEGVGAGKFDHGVRVFQQLHAHYERAIATELGFAHEGLRKATDALKVATWWLAGVTVLLGVVEIPKLFGH